MKRWRELRRRRVRGIRELRSDPEFAHGFQSNLQGYILGRLGEYSASNRYSKPAAAHKLGNRIVAMGESLSFFPERYPKLRQRPRIRRFIVHKYFKIFYSIDHEARLVEILRCWDGRRGADPALAASQSVFNP